MSMLFEPVVRFWPAPEPSATLAAPVVLEQRVEPEGGVVVAPACSPGSGSRSRRCRLPVFESSAPRAGRDVVGAGGVGEEREGPAATLSWPVVVPEQAPAPRSRRCRGRWCSTRGRSCRWRCCRCRSCCAETHRCRWRRCRCRSCCLWSALVPVALVLVPGRVSPQRVGAGGDVVVARAVELKRNLPLAMLLLPVWSLKSAWKRSSRTICVAPSWLVKPALGRDADLREERLERQSAVLAQSPPATASLLQRLSAPAAASPVPGANSERLTKMRRLAPTDRRHQRRRLIARPQAVDSPHGVVAVTTEVGKPAARSAERVADGDEGAGGAGGEAVAGAVGQISPASRCPSGPGAPSRRWFRPRW